MSASVHSDFLERLSNRNASQKERGAKPPPEEKSFGAKEHISFKLSNISNGCWYSIHLAGARGKRDTLKGLIEMYVESFSCVKCRGHIGEYYLENPLPEFNTYVPDYKRRIELFEWTSAFHNAVSKRIGKKPISDHAAREIFIELTDLADQNGSDFIANNRCTHGCDGVDGGVDAGDTYRHPPGEQEYPAGAIGAINYSTY